MIIRWFLVCAAAAATVPLHGGVFEKVWLKGTTDKEPLSYLPGETMRFTVSPMALFDDVPDGKYEMRWKQSDDYEMVAEGSMPFTGDPASFEVCLDRPGFVRLEVNVCDTATGECQVFFDGGAAVMPEALEAPDVPMDFDAFWEGQFKRLDIVPIKADLLETDCPNPKCRRWAVRVDCAGLRPVTGYLSIPKAVDGGARFPCRLTTQGYNKDAFLPNKPSSARDDEIVH